MGQGSYGLALSGSSSATSGAGGDSFGDITAGSLTLPKWLPLAFIAGFVVVAVMWLVTRR